MSAELGCFECYYQMWGCWERGVGSDLAMFRTELLEIICKLELGSLSLKKKKKNKLCGKRTTMGQKWKEKYIHGIGKTTF